MEFLQKLEKIEKVVAKYSDRLATQANSLLASHDLTSAKNLKASLKDLSDTERLMKIGIVGRVKAGKSSLLNAIAFNGKNVLPKAATPMTAALTEIGYGEKFAIEVDFFTKEDIANIKKDSDLYETEFKRITQEKIENLKKNKKYASKSEAELLQDAQRRTTSELSESRMAASKDQYDRIRKSGIDINSLDSHKQVIFDSLEDLQKSLGEYVGSSGKYMPFTRNVKIKFQTDSFKDVNIIDTPGVNDPVVSREQRTRDELGKCDVIFIVSPAGQFMSNEDLDLMDRITHKNGIRELYAVASKVDTQLLMGSIKSDANGDFKVALNRVRSVLAGEMVKRIEGLKESNPEVGDAYDSLLQNGDESVICTSGISTSIKENLDDESKLDEIEAHTIKLLRTNYPEEFNSDRSTTEANLDELAKIAELKTILDKVAGRKNEIMQQKVQDFSRQKAEIVDKYLQDLIKYVGELKSELESTDIKELEEQRKQIQNIKESASMEVNLAYQNNISPFERDLKDSLINKLNAKYREAIGSVDNAEDVKNVPDKPTKVKQKGFFGALKRGLGSITGDKDLGYDKYQSYKQVITIRAGAVTTSLRNLRDSIEQEIRDSNFTAMQSFKDKVPKEIIPALRKAIVDNGGDETSININRLRYILQSIVNSINLPDISYTNHRIPEGSGTLEGWAAESFIEESRNFIDTLQDEVKKDIIKHANSIIQTLKKVELGNELFSEYDKQLEQLKNDIENKTQAITELQTITKELSAIR